jgi:MFS transporter, DHA1 family, multidrug resistance protein
LHLFLVKETFKPVEKKNMLSYKQVWEVVTHPAIIWGMFFATLITQMTNQSINPVLSLYVQELMHGQGNITFMAGLVAAAPGNRNLSGCPILRATR